MEKRQKRSYSVAILLLIQLYVSYNMASDCHLMLNIKYYLAYLILCELDDLTYMKRENKREQCLKDAVNLCRARFKQAFSIRWHWSFSDRKGQNECERKAK